MNTVIISMIQKRIRELREQNGMSREELAEKIGITAQTIKNLETNESRAMGLRARDLDAIADIFDVSTDYLLGRTDSRTQYANIADLRRNTGLSEIAIKKLAGLYWEGAAIDIEGKSAISAFIEHEYFYDYVYQMAEAYYMLKHWEENKQQRKNDLRNIYSATDHDIYLGMIYKASSIMQNFVEKAVETANTGRHNADNTPATDADHQEV